MTIMPVVDVVVTEVVKMGRFTVQFLLFTFIHVPDDPLICLFIGFIVSFQDTRWSVNV